MKEQGEKEERFRETFIYEKLEEGKNKVINYM